mmetsp:Transcript_23156/g.72280  ORF Transcript_23156/g.72280 Transcript_23156/m.72280 type:complete len:205 (-) Transcript_23156:242-856(-)
MRGVVHHRAGHLPGLVVEIGGGPLPWGYDDRGRAPKLRGDFLAALGGALLGRPGPPHDGVVGLVGASDVDTRHQGVRSEELALLRPAVDEAQDAAGDERREDLGEEGAAGLVYLAHLAHHHRAVVEERVDDVEPGNGYLVAGGQAEAHAAAVRPPLAHCGALGRWLARLKPDLPPEAGEQDVVEAAGEHLHRLLVRPHLAGGPH